MNYWSFLSAYLYVLPLGVDLLTNAVSKPRQKDFFIVPLKTQQEADSLNRIDSLRMVAEKQTRERAKILPSKYPRHEIVGSFGFGPNQADKDQRAMNQECFHFLRLDHTKMKLFCDSYYQNVLILVLLVFLVLLSLY